MALDFSMFDKKKKPTTDTSGLDFSMFEKGKNVTNSVTGMLKKPSAIDTSWLKPTGSLAVRNNNPGNLRYAEQIGSVGPGEKGFAKFPTPEAGLKALERDLVSKFTGKSPTGLKPTDTLIKFAEKYAPKSDGNDPIKYATNIAKALGVDVNARIGDLTNRVSEVALVIVQNESADFMTHLTGAKTAQAQTKTAESKVDTSKLDFSMFKKEQNAGMMKDYVTIKNNYVTDVLGHGLVFHPRVSEIDPKLPTPEKKSNTQTSTPLYLDAEEREDARILPKPVRDAWDNAIARPIANMYLQGMKTLFTAGRVVGESAFSESTDKRYKNMDPDGIMVRTREWMNEKINAPMLEQSKKQLALLDDAQQSIALAVSDGKDGLSSWQEYLFTMANGGVSIGTSIGIGLATRNMNVSAGILSSMEASNIYNDARDAGKSPEDALRISAQGGVGTYLLEKWGIDFLFGMSGARTLSSWVMNGAIGGLAETTQEEFQNVFQNLNTKYGYDKTQGIFEGWYETAVATFIPAMLVNMALPGASRFMNRTDIITDIQKKAGVDQNTADRAWRVMRYSTNELLKSLQMKGLSIKDVSGEQTVDGDVPVTPEDMKAVSVTEDRESTTIQEARDAYKKAEDLTLMWLEGAEKGERIMSQSDEPGEHIVFSKKQSTFPEWIPEEARTRKTIDKAINYWMTGEKPADSATNINKVLDAMAEHIYSQLDTEMQASVAIDQMLQEQFAQETEQSNAMRAEMRERVMAIAQKNEGARAMEPAKTTIKRTTGQTDESGKILTTEKKQLKTKLKEQQKAAKTAAYATRVETRANILSDIREQTTEIQERRKKLTTYVNENVDKRDQARARALISNVYESDSVPDAKGKKGILMAKREIKAFARIEQIINERTKKDLRNQIVTGVKKLLSSPSVAIDFKKKIVDLMSSYELKGHSDKTITKLKALQAFVDAKTKDGEELMIPAEVLQSLDTLLKKPYEMISVREMRNLADRIAVYGQMGKDLYKSRVEQYQKEQDIWKRAMTKEDSVKIEKMEIFKEKPGDSLSLSQRIHNVYARIMNKARDVDMSLSPTDVLCDLWDGAQGTYDGIHSRMKGRIDDNWGWFANLADKLQGQVADMSREYKLKEANYKRMGIVAAREQEGGMEKLQNLGYTEQEVNAITLTKEEQTVLDEMRTVMDSQFPAVQQMMKELYNEDVKKVKNYFSFMTDFDAMADMNMRETFETRPPEFQGKPTKTIKHGFAKSRKGAGNQKIELDAMKVFTKHIENVAYFRAMGRDSKMFFEIVNSPEYAEAHGVYGQAIMKDWLDTIARKGGVSGGSQIPLLDAVRRNVSAGILGMKLSTIAIQPTALIDGMGIIGPTNALWGMEKVTLDAEARKYVLTEFPELRDRTGGEVAIRELLDTTWLQKTQRVGFMPMQYVDKLTAGAITLGAYRMSMQEQGLEIDYNQTPNKKALEFAQYALRRTQASSQFKDLPMALSRGSLTGNRSFDRMVLQFQTFLLFRWSRIRHDAIRVGINTKSPKQAVRVLTPIILASMAATGIRVGVAQAIAEMFGGDDEDKEFAEEFYKKMWYEMYGTVPFLGNLWGTFSFGGSLFPVFNVAESALEDANSALNSEEPATRQRALARLMFDITTLAGIPGSVQGSDLLQKQLKDKEKSSSKSKSKVFGENKSVFKKEGSNKVFGNSNSVFEK